MNVVESVGRAWLVADVKGDLEQWEGLPVGTGRPWKEHGYVIRLVGDDALVLRTCVPAWGMEAA